MKDNVKTIHIFQNPLHGPSYDNTKKKLMLSHMLVDGYAPFGNVLLKDSLFQKDYVVFFIMSASYFL
jgi:hypothetical protein